MMNTCLCFFKSLKLVTITGKETFACTCTCIDKRYTNFETPSTYTQSNVTLQRANQLPLVGIEPMIPCSVASWDDPYERKG